MAENGTVAYILEFPKCDVCKVNDGGRSAVETLPDAAYDARLNTGQWGYVCSIHFALYGPGSLGLGRGQRLVLESERDKKVELSEDEAIARSISRHPAGKGR